MLCKALEGWMTHTGEEKGINRALFCAVETPEFQVGISHPETSKIEGLHREHRANWAIGLDS